MMIFSKLRVFSDEPEVIFMLIMIIKMMSIVAAHILLTVLLWRRFQGRRLPVHQKILIGVIFGLCGVLSNHFNVNYGHSLLNIRDLSPLVAGLFFDPVSGIIAGFIAGIERYIIGTYFGIGSYTRIACSVSTCMAGILAAFMSVYLFDRKKPSAIYGFFMGAVVEVFHMYMVFLTHRRDITTALMVVKNNSIPMIFFTAFGLFLTSLFLQILAREWVNPFTYKSLDKVHVSQKFRFWLFVFTAGVLTLNFAISHMMHTQKAVEDANAKMETSISDIVTQYSHLKSFDEEILEKLEFHVGSEGTFDIIRNRSRYLAGTHKGYLVSNEVLEAIKKNESSDYFNMIFYGVDSRCKIVSLDENTFLLVTLPLTEVFDDRDTRSYESLFANIIMLAVLFVLITQLVKKIVVDNLDTVNESLNKITNGNLKEEVSVYDSSEFASLSNDINQMVTALKGYIAAAEKRVEQELSFAKSVQASALPKNYNFNRDDFEIYATMDPAKQVGGDFYDFFFVGPGKLALVIADVSGKGIPAALFMMRSKTAIRTVAEQDYSPVEVLEKANLSLCEGNDEKMFVSVWLGIIDLNTGVMKCCNAGHEYPMIRREDKSYELYEDPHAPILGLKKKLNLTEYELIMNPGDSIFVYTDGIPEAEDVYESLYGLDRLKKALNETKKATMKETLLAVTKDIESFTTDAEQFDDITMLGFRYLRSEP